MDRCLQLRDIQLIGLLHGGDNDFFHPLGFEYGSLRMIAKNRSNGMDANFCCFFQKPFVTLIHFGGRYGQMQSIGYWFLNRTFHNFNRAFMVRRQGDSGMK